MKGTKLRKSNIDTCIDVILTQATQHAPNSDWLCPGLSYFSGHSQSYARSFNQSDDRNLQMSLMMLNICSDEDQSVALLTCLEKLLSGM